ncbi:hypothetical protein FA15DRAFT_706525 [Coprinopsis marcescibilis]|uniref:G protein-coupled receptor n=1 Tax=Coprinopsis marcescibilis TaxID=230819 RepID=A0A5C3L204_COPMA|nr:hypothetical protein FA15DRAFT_706525 [Coprinopsis marcescibilis]
MSIAEMDRFRELTRSLVNSTYASINIYLAVSGIQLFIFLHILVIFLGASGDVRRSQKLYVTFSGLLCSCFMVVAILRSVEVGTGLVMFRSFYEAMQHASKTRLPATSVIEQVFALMLQSLGEGVLLYRCYIIWRNRKVMLLLPVTLYVASAAVGIVALVLFISTVNNDRASGDILHKGRLAAAYYLLSVSVNCTTTGLIAWPIIRMRREMRKVSANTPFDVSNVHAKTYTHVLSILAESALPFTLVGMVSAALVVILASFPASRDAIATLPIANAIWVCACALAPQLIIFRVAVGQSWTRNPTALMTTLSRPSFVEPGRVLEEDIEDIGSPALPSLGNR